MLQDEVSFTEKCRKCIRTLEMSWKILIMQVLFYFIFSGCKCSTDWIIYLQ